MTKEFFLVLVKKSMSVVVSSAILLRVSLSNLFIIEKALTQVTNTGEHILSAKSLKWGQLPGCGLGYPSIISKLLL